MEKSGIVKTKNKDNILAIILTLLIAFLYISGIPSAFFIDVHWADVDPVCVTLLVNIAIVMFIGICAVKVFMPKFRLGFQRDGFICGLKRYGLSCVIALVVACTAFGAGLSPFDYTPTIWKVLIDGVIYYIGVGIIEEFFCRGLLQNAISGILQRHKHAELIAVLSASLIFGAGHIFGMIGMPLILIACKLAWAVGLGVYLGAIYSKTRNLWLVSLFHFVIDLCGLPFCFSTQKTYPTTSAVIILITFILLGIYGVRILLKGEQKPEQLQ